MKGTRYPVKHLMIAVALGVGTLGVAAPAIGAPHHEQTDGCDHGATSKPCRPDPSPHGKDCLAHGNHGGINEDHCLEVPTSTTTTIPTDTTDTTSPSPNSPDTATTTAPTTADAPPAADTLATNPQNGSTPETGPAEAPHIVCPDSNGFTFKTDPPACPPIRTELAATGPAWVWPLTVVGLSALAAGLFLFYITRR